MCEGCVCVYTHMYALVDLCVLYVYVGVHVWVCMRCYDFGYIIYDWLRCCY